jgi:hypothetical protein
LRRERDSLHTRCVALTTFGLIGDCCYKTGWVERRISQIGTLGAESMSRLT